MSVTALTRLAAVIGNPVRHSLSPVMHNAWCKALQVDAVYLALEASTGTFESLVRGLAASGAAGVNVTVPFKEQALAIADQASPAATRSGAANTLVFREGAIVADNTDGAGLLADLGQRAPDWLQHTGQTVILGAGGAARGIAAALLADAQTEPLVVARRSEQAEALCADLGGGRAVPWSDLEGALDGAGLLINATPLGLGGRDPLKLELSRLASGATVYDTVYVPRETALLADARACGLSGLDGLGMLVGQGAMAFERFFGVRPDPVIGLAAIEHHLEGQHR